MRNVRLENSTPIVCAEFSLTAELARPTYVISEIDIHASLMQ
jgi:hypothetical protein